MLNDYQVGEHGSGTMPESRTRFCVYWISSAVATLIFVLFMITMLMVPGVMLSAELWMLSIAGVASAVSLGVGMWKFGRTEAPVTTWPLGPISGVVLLVELVMCAINILLLLHSAHLRF